MVKRWSKTVVKNGGQKRWSNLEGGVHPLAGGVDDGCHRQREEELEPVPAAVKHTGQTLVKYCSNTGQRRRPIAAADCTGLDTVARSYN